MFDPSFTAMKLCLIGILGVAFLFGCKTEEDDRYRLSLERVVDGDTFYADELKIRIWGIDAPEREDPNYLASKVYLEVLLKDGRVDCEEISKDPYGRIVMQCLSGKYDIAAELVKMGMATDYKKYSKGFYDNEEREARTNKRGIWK